MNPRTKKRLDAIEDKLSPDTDKSGVVFIPLKGETGQEMDQRMARWYAGEKVEGQDKMYTGREFVVMRIKYVEAKCPQSTQD
jgi:hypothetical protein